VLVVAMPDASALQARAFGDDWLALDLPRHLVHVPGSALLDRVAAAGLRTERVSHWRGGQIAFGWAHGLVKRTSGLDLYDAIRRPEARMAPMGAGRRVAALGLGAVLAPIAVVGAAGEVVARHSGSIYVEARTPLGDPNTAAVESR
jgi:hypothetical protein